MITEKADVLLCLLQAGDGPVMKHSIFLSWTKVSNEIVAICLNVELLLKAFIFKHSWMHLKSVFLADENPFTLAP